MTSRQSINQVICNVLFKHRSLRDCLQSHTPQIHAYAFDICRWYYRLDAISKVLLHKPLKAKDQDIQGLILLGLYQLAYTDVPDHAAIHETVAATPKKKAWARGLVNKVLRRFLAEKEAILESIDKQYTVKYAHPQWMIDAFKKDYPNDWEIILKSNNMKPPLFLRVNQQKISTSAYQQTLKEAEIIADTVTGYPQALFLSQPVSVDKLPGFFDGLCSVQDISGQNIPEVLQLKPGIRVLDACAAPGSKTCHILETEPKLAELVALDIDKERLKSIKDNLKRLQLPIENITLKAADAADRSAWWDGQQFDRILIDAPCSGSGVIRRHPDIKVLREPSDIPQFVDKQTRLIEALLPLLTPDGILVYSTCSVFKAETQNALLKDAKTKQYLSHTDLNSDGFSITVQ